MVSKDSKTNKNEKCMFLLLLWKTDNNISITSEYIKQTSTLNMIVVTVKYFNKETHSITVFAIFFVKIIWTDTKSIKNN